MVEREGMSLGERHPLRAIEAGLREAEPARALFRAIQVAESLELP